MVEKDILAANYRIQYSGPFKVGDLYDAIDKWIAENGSAKEIKEQVQHQKKTGAKIRVALEIWKQLEHHVIQVLKCNIFMKDVKNITIEQGKKKIPVQHGDLIIELEGWVEKFKAQEWQNRPIIYFTRGILDRFFFKNLYDMHNGQVKGDTVSLYEFIEDYLLEEKERYN